MNGRIMMKKLITMCGLSLMVLISAGQLAARRLINFEVSVREKVSGSDDNFVLIDKREFQVVEGMKTTGFMGNFTLDLTATCDDSGQFVCNFSMYTIGSKPQSYFKQFTSGPGGVYFIDNVRVKDGLVFRVGISPLSLEGTEVDIENCNYDPMYGKDWAMDPSANFDLYFVPRSLADSHWGIAKDYLEENYRRNKSMMRLGFPGKISYFLSPCPIPQMIWDERMGYSIDPMRANCFALYGHNANTVDAIPAVLVQIYRYFGYAPPMLAEGLAAYFDAPHYYARMLKNKDRLPGLNSLYKSSDYFMIPGTDGLAAASSFAKYLIDVYGLEKYRKLYDRATDLNVPDQLENIYGHTAADLEVQWLNVLDTISYSVTELRAIYENELLIFRRQNGDIFLKDLMNHMNSYYDSVYAISDYAWFTYMDGDYSASAKAYEQMMKLEPGKTYNLMLYGNIMMMQGNYDSAMTMYHRTLATDSTVKEALYKIGESWYWLNQSDSVRYYLQLDINEDQSQLSRSSSAVILGEMALRQGDTTSAREYYQKAQNFMGQIMQGGRDNSAFLIRMGEAYLGLYLCGDTVAEKAAMFLESADFYNIDPLSVLYDVRVTYSLGLLNDMLGNREKALEYYKRALENPMSDDWRRRFEKYIITPFKGY